MLKKKYFIPGKVSGGKCFISVVSFQLMRACKLMTFQLMAEIHD